MAREKDSGQLGSARAIDRAGAKISDILQEAERNRIAISLTQRHRAKQAELAAQAAADLAILP
jgi:hypothetical protein